MPLLFLRGRCCFWSFEPFTTRPCLLFNCLSSSFFSLFGAFVNAVSLSLFLSLSGAGETQTFLVWVSPCVFAATISFYDPRFPPAPVFFFDVARLFGGCWSWLVVFALGLSLSLGDSVALCACMHLKVGERGWPIRRRPRLISLSLFFGDVSTERCLGLSVQSRLCSPHHLPQSRKAGAGRGGGGAGRTVTQMLFWTGGLSCHANASLICPVSKGEMLSVFSSCVFLCLVRRLSSFFTVLLFLGSLFEKIFGSELLFYVVGVGLVFFGLFCLCFCFIICFFRSRNCLEKILLMSGPVFWVFFSLPLVFSPTSSSFLFLFLFSFKRDSSGSHRAHPHTHLLFLFLFLVFVPAATGLISRLGRASFLSRVLSGCHSGPRAVW